MLSLLRAALFASIIGLFFAPAAVSAQPSTSTVAGRILETSAGLPVRGATVALTRGTTIVASATTVADGTFTMVNVPPGEYSLAITATGYQNALRPTVVVAPGQERVEVNATLTPAAAGTKIIGSTKSAPLQTTATINENLNPNILQDQNYLRAGDALGTLPFVTAQTSSSVADDETIQLRGFDPSESVPLIDGHPVGPLGACPAAANPLVGGACPYNAQGSVFDYQLAQFWGMSNITVTYGSGATGLYGIPTLGGSVNFQTLNPTPTDHVTALQGFGAFGKAMTGLSSTGTAGKLGWALAYGVEGTDGLLDGDTVETAMLSGANIVKALGGKDQQYCVNSPAYATYGKNVPATLTAADVAACTVDVGSEFTGRNAVAKLTYQFDPNTSLLISAYNATSYANGIGNGENYFIPSDQVLSQADIVLAGGKNNFKLANGTKTTCSSTTLAVLVDAAPGYECLTATQFASELSGPYDKGPGVWHAGLNQDYHAQLTTKVLGGQLLLDGYVDNYNYLNQKSVIIGYDEQDVFLTHGALVSDEYAWANNDLSFGVSFQHQLHFTNQWTSPPCAGNCYVAFPFGDTNYFIHDVYTANKQLAVFADATLDNSKVSGTDTFDPRLSLVYRPTPNDVVRVSGGAASISPDPVLYNGGTSPPSQLLPLYNQLSSGALNGFAPSGPACAPLVPVIQGFNPNVKPEVADDVELALAHRFAGSATAEFDAYNTTETNPIITDVAPFSSLPAPLFASFQAANPTYIANALSELNGPGGCGSGYTESDLGVSTPLNAGGAIYRGATVSLKLPLTPQFEVDAGYTVQTAYYVGLPPAVLVNNGGYVNGQQFYGIPIDTATLGAGYNHSGWTARIDSYLVGSNNALYRPTYWYANLNVAKTVGPVTLNLGISNLFDTAVQYYGINAAGTAYPQNQFVTAAPTKGQEFGLAPQQISGTVTVHI